MMLVFKSTGERQLWGATFGVLIASGLGLVAFGWNVISGIIAFLLLIIIIGRHSRQPT